MKSRKLQNIFQNISEIPVVVTQVVVVKKINPENYIIQIYPYESINTSVDQNRLHTKPGSNGSTCYFYEVSMLYIGHT